MNAARATAAFLVRRFWRLTLAGAFGLILVLRLDTTHQAQAVIEQIYTLPFEDTYIITCRFGPYEPCGLSGFHYGTDYQLGNINAPGEPVVAAANGTTWLHDQLPDGAGLYIVMDHGNGHRTRYLHLSSRTVTDGQAVARGQLIGYEGNSGTSAYHLHFETRHNGTSGSNCCSGTAVDPYASSTYMWTTDPPSYYAGTDTPGWYRRADVSWHLNNSLPPSGSNITFQFGDSTASPPVIPVVADWDGDGHDTAGWFRPSDWSWHLNNNLPPSGPNITFQMGDLVDHTIVPVTGDWDGDGHDTAGWFRPSDWSWHLNNNLPPSGPNITFQMGDLVDHTIVPVTGDWDGQ